MFANMLVIATSAISMLWLYEKLCPLVFKNLQFKKWSKHNSKCAYFVVFRTSALTGSCLSSLRVTWHWPLKENGAEERNMATSTNPRKFSEKIALHNQKQAEETAAFEEVMKDLSITRAARVTNVVLVFFYTPPPLYLFSVCFQRAVKYARSRGRIGKQ